MKTAELRPNISEFESLGELRDVLEELLRLLDEYGPWWYSEELHERISASLKRSRR